MTSFPAAWRSLSPAARLLIINGFAFNLGFYMMMPYLALHLGGTLGLAGWITGLIMGVRVFSQQGLFLLGGTLGDRIGYRPAIIGGCLVRSIGFALLGWAEHVPLLLLAAFLTGFAGALFTPCAQAYLASECRSDELRQQAFSLHNLAGEAGMLLGPLVGMALTQTSYTLTGLLSGGIFLLLTFLQWYWLPANRQPSPSDQRHGISATLAQWRGIARNAPFMRFALCATAYQILFHQLYLAIPAYIQHSAHDSGLLGTVFTVTALIGVTLQLSATRLVQTRLGTARGIGLGLAAMGASYPLLHLLAPWPAPAVLAYAVLFSLGSILCFPLFAARLPRYAQPDRLGSYYGFYASLGGCVALLANLAVGSMLGPAGSAPSPLLWYALAFIACIAGALLYHQVRREDRSEINNF